MDNNLIEIKYRNDCTVLGVSGLGKYKFTAFVKHKGLQKCNEFGFNNQANLERHITEYVLKLEEKWNKIVKKEYTTKSLKEAELRTKEAVFELNVIDNILINTFNSGKYIDWNDYRLYLIDVQEKDNSNVELLKEKYFSNAKDSVLGYCKYVLSKSVYPESFPKNFEIDYNPENKILIIEYSLPNIEQLPRLTEVRFIKNELKNHYLSETQIIKMYDKTIYNITLRTIFEIFNSDSANAIDAISFNGWVNAINKSTGKLVNNCILSILIKKVDFKEINLKYIDSKIWFKNSKGISSSKLSGLIAIQPILQINRNDKRFTSNYEVVNSIDMSTNLASMNWEDFEHLIREIFEKEFSSNGGEAKVTQASRDGGVDVIAFDPDPIRGGKIVIQAKRYTNTVEVSAVRDLFGTVMNEGATKGILVTTSDYGPDAYDFVKGKPLTLLNGANLLYLLEKHGYKARIDIIEARKIMKEGMSEVD